MIEQFITPASVANGIVADKTFTGIYLIVEGKTDNLFFSKFIEKQNCRIVIAFGNEKVIEIIDILEKRNYKNAIAVIDSDFRKILNKIPQHSNIIMTETHDIETLIIKSSTFEYVINSLVSSEKYNHFLSEIKGSFRNYILELLAKPIAIFRLINEIDNLGLKFKPAKLDDKELKYNEFIEKDTFTFSGYEKLITTVKNYYNQKPSLSVSDIKLQIENYSKNNYDLYELCNGHDITHIISISLQKRIGSEKIEADEIGKRLINSYDSAYFEKTELFKNMVSWQATNSHINIFNSEIFGYNFYISNPLENAIKIQILSLNGLAFQEFIDQLFKLLYGDDYLTIKQKHDKGCDGILKDTTILSVYAPEKYQLDTFKNKITDDFNKYEKNWKNKYPSWLVVFNGEITAEMKLYVDSLYSKAKINGNNEIISRLFSLNQRKLLNILNYLKIHGIDLTKQP